MKKTTNKKYNMIDLFAGCGGLVDGFEKTGNFKTLACVEWEKEPCLTLVNRLNKKWGYKNSDDLVLHFDIQRDNELFSGWKDHKYGSNTGLDSIIGENKVDIIVGGPPCQAYSIAGRIRDDKGMKKDYRNYLFESYVKVVNRYKPKVFVFENVFGILSAKPDGTPILDEIKKSFKDIGYEIVENIRKNVLFNVTDYGVPQNRSRVILIGLKKDVFKDPQKSLLNFYENLLPSNREKIMTVRDAIADLPPLLPLKEPTVVSGKKVSHGVVGGHLNHFPRFHNGRDISIFKELSLDIETGENKYSSTEKLRKLYTKVTGKDSKIHKYHVINWGKPSNTIVAHLFKDGLRHIHPDSKQGRTITVREAARLQTFDDDFEFLGPISSQYKMVGNAVPPKFANKIAGSVSLILEETLGKK